LGWWAKTIVSGSRPFGQKTPKILSR
jgi:hypothetical protein